MADPEAQKKPSSTERRATLHFKADIHLAEAWPWVLVVVVSSLGIVLQSAFRFVHGIGLYMYVVGCAAVGIVGLIGLFGLRYNIPADPKVASLDELASEVEGLVAQIESSRPDYRDHWNKVAILAAAIGQRLEMPSPEISSLEQAAAFMDIGMLPMMDELGGPMSEEVRARLERHPVRSEERLRSIDTRWDVLPAVRHHHERYDGSGYPEGLSGDDIPTSASILAVADAFVAMRSERPYRPRKTLEEALNELRAYSGTQFDPRAVRAVFAIAAKDPGSLP